MSVRGGVATYKPKVVKMMIANVATNPQPNNGV